MFRFLNLLDSSLDPTLNRQLDLPTFILDVTTTDNLKDLWVPQIIKNILREKPIITLKSVITHFFQA